MSQTDELLSMVEKPKKKKRPSNVGLWVALIFFNLAALVIDAISGITVARLAHGLWGYGLMVFLAGFIPLLMHEILYTRPFANQNQQTASIYGAATAVLSVAVVGVLSAYANVNNTSIPWAATAAVVFTVIAVVWHGLLAAYYFYTDDGIKAEHIEAETVASYQKQVKNLQRASEILALTAKAQSLKHALEQKYHDPRVVAAVLRQLDQDSDGDGIPDFIDPTPHGERPTLMAPSPFNGNGRKREPAPVMENPTSPRKP